MKVLCELPNLEKLLEVGKERGFMIEIPEITIANYRVKVSCDGVTKTAWVEHKQHRKKTVLDTGRWYSNRGEPRLRISIGKKVNVIGSKIKWTMSKFSKTELDKEEPDNNNLLGDTGL